MKIDMADVVRSPAHRGQGRITGPDGRGYAPVKRRVKRRECDVIIGEGSPLSIYVYGWGVFDWYDGDDAPRMWAEVRAHGILVGTERDGKRQGLTPKAELWVAEDGSEMLHLEGNC